MPGLILRRLRDLVFMTLIMEFLTIVMLEATPGSYCSFALPDHASLEARQACEVATEVSIWNKYSTSLNQLAHFNLGTSLTSRRPVITELAEQLPSTFRLGAICFCISLITGMLAGVIAVRNRSNITGYLVNWAGISILSLPSFVLAIVLIKVVALHLGWVRILGDAHEWRMMVLPILSISFPLSAWFMRITRNAIADILSHDYIRTAKAKGLRKNRIFIHHALRNALSAIIPLAGIALAGLLDGTLLIEIIFNRPGLGRYTLEAVQTHNYPALQGVVLLVMVITVIANLLADMGQAALFPQSRTDLFNR